jgi:hypothetical protein
MSSEHYYSIWEPAHKHAVFFSLTGTWWTQRRGGHTLHKVDAATQIAGIGHDSKCHGLFQQWDVQLAHRSTGYAASSAAPCAYRDSAMFICQIAMLCGI